MTLLNSEIVIDAPSEVVWQVLVDFDSYPDWNPVEIQARGEAVVGAPFEHTGKHFEIDSLGDDRSRLRQFEHFSGIMVPFMRGVLRDTKAAFELANAAVKQRAESLAADGQDLSPMDVR